jgi:hypothetical protein
MHIDVAAPVMVHRFVPILSWVILTPNPVMGQATGLQETLASLAIQDSWDPGETPEGMEWVL